MKLLHAADLHLDSAFSALSPSLAAKRRQEQREMIFRLVELCNANDCDLMLLAGDLFDSENVYPDTVEALCEAFSDCRCRIYISPGNHDYCTAAGVYSCKKWPENVHIFTKNAIECVELAHLSCRVYGAGFTAMDCAPLLADFSAPCDGFCNLMVLHGDCTNSGSPCNPISRAQIAASNLDYLALGHIHAQSGLKKEGGTFYAWPGCAMGRGFDEPGQKGCYLCEIEKGSVRAEFVPLDGRKYEILRVNAADVERALPPDTENDVYRIILEGESEKIDLLSLYSKLSPRFFSLQLKDETVPPRALWDGSEEDTLRGLFLRELKARYEAADDDETRKTIVLAVQYGMNAMDGREAVI